jgi:very-short-patch-repair endonuclease
MMTPDQNKQNKEQRNGKTVVKSSEAYLWILLHNKKLKGNRFFRHYRFDEYFIDFYCPDASLAIVIDSDELYTDFSLESCCERENYLESMGIHVLRIDSKDILKDSDLILDKIITELSASAVCSSLKNKVDSLESIRLN